MANSPLRNTNVISTTSSVESVDKLVNHDSLPKSHQGSCSEGYLWEGQQGIHKTYGKGL